jgi:hypothetical protein
MMKLEKIQSKNDTIKWPKSTQINLRNSWLGLWDYDNFIEKNTKQMIMINS